MPPAGKGRQTMCLVCYFWGKVKKDKSWWAVVVVFFCLLVGWLLVIGFMFIVSCLFFFFVFCLLVVCWLVGCCFLIVSCLLVVAGGCCCCCFHQTIDNKLILMDGLTSVSVIPCYISSHLGLTFHIKHMSVIQCHRKLLRLTCNIPISNLVS